MRTALKCHECCLKTQAARLRACTCSFKRAKGASGLTLGMANSAGHGKLSWALMQHPALHVVRSLARCDLERSENTTRRDSQNF